MTNIMLSALVFGLGYVTALYKLSLLLLLLLLLLLMTVEHMSEKAFGRYQTS